MSSNIILLIEVLCDNSFKKLLYKLISVDLILNISILKINLKIITIF